MIRSDLLIRGSCEGFLKMCLLVSQSCPTLCDPMNHSTSGLPVHHKAVSQVTLLQDNEYAIETYFGEACLGAPRVFWEKISMN